MDSVADSIEIRLCKFGKGLFAKKNIPAFSLLCNISGKSLNFKDTLSLKQKESHALQIGVDQYILCPSPFLYSNHSCEPNCGVNQNLQFITIKNIVAGEELLWDYSTSMLERHWTMTCLCNTASCRKTVTDFDRIPHHVQQHYLRLNVVLPFIPAQIRHRIAI
jgi:hypothetical protein